MAFVTSLLWQWSDGQGQTPPPVVVPPPDTGRGRRRRKEYVVIDDVVFEVADDAEAQQLIQRAHDLAREAAAAKAKEALAAAGQKQAQKPKRRAKPPRAEIQPPKIELSAGLVSLQAQADHAQQIIAAIYQQAVQAEIEARAQEERDVISVLEAVDRAESELLARYLKEND